MDVTSSQTTYRETGFYSSIILDYLEGNQQLNPFYKHPVSLDGIKAAIEERKLYNTDRKLLVDVLQKHYEGKIPTPQQQFNIKQVGNSNCFTITTAHQPNIFTGHLYFIYKILHTIKLCKQLKADMPENDFVPIFIWAARMQTWRSLAMFTSMATNMLGIQNKREGLEG